MTVIDFNFLVLSFKTQEILQVSGQSGSFQNFLPYLQYEIKQKNKLNKGRPI